MTKQEAVEFNLKVLVQEAIIEMLEESLERGKAIIKTFSAENDNRLSIETV